MQENKEIIKRDRRKGGAWKKYAGYGLTAFFVLAAVVLLVFMFVQRETFVAFVESIKKAAAPAIYGAIFAYLMNPLMKFFEDKFKRLFFKRIKNVKRANKVIRVVSIILTLLVVLFLIGFLMYMLIPELTKTVTQLATDLPQQYRNMEEWYLGLEMRHTKVGEVIDSGIMRAGEFIEDFIDNKLIATVTDMKLLGSVFSGVKNVFSVLYNTLIGLVFSVYLLGYKEKIVGISKKIVYSISKRKSANTIIRIARECNVKFTTSFTGKIVDSIIVGMICFVAMAVLKLPYATLISVVIGVTNVIPFFGPIIGAAPCALLILVVSPIKCLYFIIMIIVLQQLDANVLTPKIVGDSIGLSPIWVLFACVFFGSLWGVAGMLLAVPLMACIYMIVKEIVENRLYRRGLELSTDYYEDLDYEEEIEIIRIKLESEEPIKSFDKGDSKDSEGASGSKDDESGVSAEPSAEDGLKNNKEPEE